MDALALSSAAGRQRDSAGDFNYSTSACSISRASHNSGGSSNGGGPIRHSDTQFDSSADETVVPYMIGERCSREFTSTNSIERFDPESSPKSHISNRLSRISINTEQCCGTLYEETLEAQLIVPTTPSRQISSNNNLVMSDPESDYPTAQPDGSGSGCEAEEPSENHNLVSGKPVQPQDQTKSSFTSRIRGKADYRVGSCYHCLINIPPGSLVAWIFSFIAIIGWSTSTWLSLDSGKDLLKWIQSADDLTYEEIALIAISLATVLTTVVFLIIATFSSHKMSRYAFSSSKKNTFGYCLSITVVILCFIGILFWTGIVGLTMIPVAGLSVIHILVGGDYLSCLHLPSYGVGAGMMTNSISTTSMPSSIAVSPAAAGAQVAVNNLTSIANITMSEIVSAVTTGSTTPQSVGVMANMTTVASGNVSSSVDLLCDGELDKWMVEAWRTLVPLLNSLGFAFFIEACLLGFLVAASSNARHLKERMEYMNDSYQYSTDNINGNVKPIAQDKSPHNNNQSDTAI